MDRRDDFFGVDALEVDAGGAEVGVSELALDDVERHAFAREFDSVHSVSRALQVGSLHAVLPVSELRCVAGSRKLPPRSDCVGTEMFPVEILTKRILLLPASAM